MLFFVDTGLPKNSVLFLKTAALALKILLFSYQTSALLAAYQLNVSWCALQRQLSAGFSSEHKSMWETAIALSH